MISQKDNNLVQVQQQCSVYFSTETTFGSWFFLADMAFWMSKFSLILMILIMAKYHENLLIDSPLTLLSMVKFFISLETKVVLKMPNETFLRINRYIITIFSFYHWYLNTLKMVTFFWYVYKALEYKIQYELSLSFLIMQICWSLSPYWFLWERIFTRFQNGR